MKPPGHEQRIAAEAAQWQRLLATGSAREHAEFAVWVKASPRHLQEFMFMEALDAASEGIDAERRIDIDALLAQVPGNVVTLQTEKSSVKKKIGLHKPWAIAAATAAVAVTVLLTWSSLGTLGWQEYTTATGEQRALELDDGSLVHLNTQSRLKVRFSGEQRELRLLSGEALFKVARDPQRPFRVHAGDMVIRAVGTQFNVYNRGAGTEVAVLEGRVEISRGKAAEVTPALPHPRQFTAGDEVRIGETTLAVQTAQDINAFASWRQRRLVFQEETLANIAMEFNRYNRTLQIKVEGAARDERYGGTFDADDPESLAQYVMQKGYLSIRREPGRIVIR